ncbi:Na+/H+ antiporter subunit E, partial [bacterium]|nr:Na+/H+ antiporter subunit E [bacterium]
RGGLIVEFILYFLKELVIANLRLMITILSPRMKLRPGVVEISLDLREDIPIVLLVNLISLTPGTLGLDVASDRSAYFVHTLWLDDPEQFEANIKNGFERRIQEIFEK